jgi:uncharacterized protein (TIGR03435 family)
MRTHVVAAGLVIVAAAVLVVFAAMPLHGQRNDEPKFDVVSVKPNRSPEPGGRNALERGTYEGLNVTVRRMIALAYMPMPFSLIDGGPDWIGSDRFDVRAKVPDGTPRERLQQMMRNMLAERFQLRTHLEKRPTPIYALIVERPGVLGPSLQPAKIDCANPAADRQPGVPWCAFQYTEGLLRGRGVTLDQVAGEIAAGRIVVNRTGLTGRYDVELRWTPDPSITAAADAPPGLVTAVREQLGLRLQSDTAEMEHLVIDSVERPEPD